MTLTATDAITLLLVDDSELVRTGLKTLLGVRGQTTQLRVVGEAHSVASAIAETLRLKPQVVLLDIRLPDGTGFEACRQILAKLPETRVLILTSVIDDNLVYEAMSSGAHGYLLKEINAQGLWQAIIDVAAGKFILDPAVTTRVLNLVRHGAPQSEQDKLAQLSAQERRVLALVAEGKTNKEIAEQMNLSDKTVKNYLSNIFEKLQISRRSQAAVLYAESRTPAKGAKQP
ncbi:MAG: response regulator transcription factor [Candidatus Didemnitutus sp.]|jgi:two-component system response regulator DevR|nr:response regulator transcription factor [Candidatus Didemnitutus sp.]